MTRRTAFAAAAALVLLAAAGCLAGPPDDAPTPTERRDTHTIDIPARSDLEFKLYLRAGDRIEYTWFATDFLEYDFHGEEDGAPPDEYTSHRQGDARDESDEFTAPFSGTHGWWWRNGGSDEVRVTLTTDGVYAVVGVL